MPSIRAIIKDIKDIKDIFILADYGRYHNAYNNTKMYSKQQL